MKKVILGAAALMIGGIAFAQDSGQNMAEPIFLGPQETVMNKSSNANANAAETYQLGNDNKVRVAQAGTLQTAYVSQDNGDTGVGGNLAMIQQTGEVGPTSGVENAAEIKQSGEGNAVGIGQQGDKNSAVAYQGNGGFNSAGNASSTGNVALIQQGDGQQAEFNAAESYQDGNNNFAMIEQTSDRNKLFNEQIGNDNKVVLDQNSAPNLSDGHQIRSQQIGDRNEGVITQSGTAQGGGDTGSNYARLLQSGTDNSSKQMQNTIANEGVIGESAIVNQGFSQVGVSTNVRDLFDNDGQANSNGTTDVFGQLNEVDADNDLNATALGSVGAEAVQMQSGKMSVASINQFGGSLSAKNEAQQNQSGWNQEALIVQHGSGSAGNFAFQDQRDDNNTAGIGQRGNGNMAQQTQDGKRNNAFSSQVGDDLKVSTRQTGNDSRLETLQNGVGNAIVISQEDGQSAWVEQNRGEMGAGGNQAGIIQTGPNGSLPGDLGDATLNCDFQSIMPTPPIETSTITINDLCPDCN